MVENDTPESEGAPAPSSEAETTSPQGSDYVSDRDFTDFPISEEVLRGVLEHGFKTATPVQAATIDAAVAGRDLIVRAKTGTGKTAAFAIPIVERLTSGARKPCAIILEPTRELAMQTAEQAAAFARHKDVKVALLVGGVAMGPQEEALSKGAELLVGTPGRILDHIRRGNLKPEDVEMVCLDEADEMLSMGFFEDVNKIIGATKEGRQVLLFSATISDDTQRLVQRYLTDHEDIILSTDADGVELLEHIIYETQPGMHKVRSLLFLLDNEEPTSAIIFCNTREDTATVATYLDRQGLDVQLISGELSQARRSAVMRRIKSGEVRFLVATDVAARGIDISNLSHVINYALPQDAAVYLHRTGRTGRIGKKGTAISLVGGSDMNTRKTLVSKHQIAFVQRELPDNETAVRKRVERQAEQIKAALGNLVFESYLPTVRALKERPDGEMLLAAALRAFFQWDRQRRAEIDGISAVESIAEARSAKMQAKAEGRRGRRKDDRRRDDRRKDDRKRGRDRKRRSDDEDLDDLLEADDAPPASEDAPKKKKRRRRRKKKGENTTSEASANADSKSNESDDIELSFDDVVEEAPKAKAKAKKPSKPAPKQDDDFDDLFELDD
ncbi:MAG: DEAD/DEAH box helicase [Myxococcota bacterium]